MSQIQYLYAFDDTDKKIVCINDFNTKDEAKKHSFSCISCGRELLSRAIESHKMSAHFYHKEDNCSKESYLHKLGKIIIKEMFNTQEEFIISYPNTIICDKMNECKLSNNLHCTRLGTNREINLKEYYDICEEESKVDNFVADLLLKSSKNKNLPPILIEIYVTHKSEEQKIKSGHRIIEIKIENESDIHRIIRQDQIKESENIKFYNFNNTEKQKLKIKELFRYILRKNDIGYGCISKINCRDAIYRKYEDSIVELNFEHKYSYPNDSPLRDYYTDKIVPLKWMAKYKNLKNCLLCKYHKRYPSKNKYICTLNKKFGLKETPEYKDAKNCNYYRLSDKFHFELLNYNVEEVNDNLFNREKKEYRVIVAGEKSFNDNDIFEEKLDYYLKSKKETHSITILCATSLYTQIFIEWYGNNHNIVVEKYNVINRVEDSIEDMVNSADAMIVFANGKGNITEKLIYKAKNKGLLVKTIKYDETKSTLN